jgi:SAM-dependent methyltransferase
MAASVEAHVQKRSARSISPLCCLVCGQSDATNVVRYASPDPYERAVGIAKEGYFRAWVRCVDCGFIYSRYSRDPEVLDRLYESNYRDSAMSWRQGSTREVFDRVIALAPEQSETHARIAWIKREIGSLEAARLVPARPGAKAMLDIGGATGVFAYGFRDADWSTHVVDPAESGRFLETDFDIPYHQGPYRPGLFGRTFDLISLVFVLEHLRDPNAILASIAQDLAPGGLLYIEVPDSVAFRLKPPEDDIFNACHLWMFNPTSLTRLLANNGFELMALTRPQTRRGHYALTVLSCLA